MSRPTPTPAAATTTATITPVITATVLSGPERPGGWAATAATTGSEAPVESDAVIAAVVSASVTPVEEACDGGCWLPTADDAPPVATVRALEDGEVGAAAADGGGLAGPDDGAAPTMVTVPLASYVTPLSPIEALTV